MPYTIALNHQFHLTAEISHGDLFSFELELFGSSTANADCFFEAFECGCLFASSTIAFAKRATIDGIAYEPGNVIRVGVCEDKVPNFMKIDHIVVGEESTVVCVGNLLQIVQYNEHYHSWQVNSADAKVFCYQRDLVYPHPLSIVKPFASSEYFISPKFYLETTPPCRRV